MNSGVVKGLSANRRRVAVLTDDGYTVFDIESGEPPLRGHTISGALNEHGSTVLTNETTGQTTDACVEAIHATRESALSLLG